MWNMAFINSLQHWCHEFLVTPLFNTHRHTHTLCLLIAQCSLLCLISQLFSLCRPAERPLGALWGPYSCPNTPSEGLGKFLALLSLLSLPGEQVQHSAHTWKVVCWGHAMAARWSLVVTLPFLSLAPHCPGYPDSQFQLHNCPLLVQSAKVTNN